VLPDIRHTGSIYGLYNWLFFTNSTTLADGVDSISPVFSTPENPWILARQVHYSGRKELKKTMKRLVAFLASAVLMIPAVMQAKPVQPVSLQEAVRHELSMMSRYTVFDDISFRLDGDTVILTGEVHRPIVKSDAKDAVRHVEGVNRVVNNIEVLPLSPNDDRIRLAVYRAIYGAPTLSARYAQLAYPPIHILVKNGHVRLEGFVANQMDRNIAGIRANGVFGAFSVQNDLKVG